MIRMDRSNQHPVYPVIWYQAQCDICGKWVGERVLVEKVVTTTTVYAGGKLVKQSTVEYSNERGQFWGLVRRLRDAGVWIRSGSLVASPCDSNKYRAPHRRQVDVVCPRCLDDLPLDPAVSSAQLHYRRRWEPASA